jgi:hypothetical protein
MKRELTYKEIEEIILFEDTCGVNNLIQEIFSAFEEQEIILGKHYKVIADINEKDEISEYEFINLTTTH